MPCRALPSEVVCRFRRGLCDIDVPVGIVAFVECKVGKCQLLLSDVPLVRLVEFLEVGNSRGDRPDRVVLSMPTDSGTFVNAVPTHIRGAAGLIQRAQPRVGREFLIARRRTFEFA